MNDQNSAGVTEFLVLMAPAIFLSAALGPATGVSVYLAFLLGLAIRNFFLDHLD